MTTDLNEAVAKKMGWMKDGNLWYHLHPECNQRVWVDDLPSFTSDWNATIILIKWMRGRGWRKTISTLNYFGWANGPNLETASHYEVQITSDDIPLAACQAFLLIPDKDLEVE